MSAVLKSAPPSASPLVEVKSAEHDVQVALARCVKLRERLLAIETKHAQSITAALGHRAEVTAALLGDDAPMPKAIEPAVIDPADAVAVVRKALDEAEEALAVERGKYRAAVVHLVQARRDSAFNRYRAATQMLVEAVRDSVALDRVLIESGSQMSLPPILHSRLSIPALRGDPQMSPGLALDGRSFLGSPAIWEAHVAARAALAREIEAELPF